MAGTSNKLEMVISEIKTELNRASKQHPLWPDDIIHQVAIMAEESGEAVRAALNYVYEDKSIDDVRTELIQTGAMAIRCLINLEGKK